MNNMMRWTVPPGGRTIDWRIDLGWTLVCGFLLSFSITLAAHCQHLCIIAVDFIPFLVSRPLHFGVQCAVQCCFADSRIICCRLQVFSNCLVHVITMSWVMVEHSLGYCIGCCDILGLWWALPHSGIPPRRTHKNCGCLRPQNKYFELWK